MGRKSGKKQQKRRQQQQRPPGDVGPRYVVDEWCPGCGEFGHTVAICPTQYQEEVEPQPQEEDGWEALLRSMGVPYCCFICREVGHFPANCPLPPVRDLWYPPTPAEGEFLLVPPPPTAGAEQQELSLSPPQSPAEGEFLLVPPPPAEGACLLVPPPSPPPAEGACLLVSRLQLEGEEALPPSQPEGEEALPPSAPSPPSPPSSPPSLPAQSPSQPEGEEDLPPSQPEGEEPLPPSAPSPPSPSSPTDGAV
ncbi:UNVERIFIED_CONTAM: hypothetical protein FKN15_066963 [Acipenser sinensis]